MLQDQADNFSLARRTTVVLCSFLLFFLTVLSQPANS